MILRTVLIAIALSMDTMAVSVAAGASLRNLRISDAFRIAFSFGLFQAVMPVVGWLAGAGLRAFVSGVDHWVAFGLLAFIGSKMIWESFQLQRPQGNALCRTTLLVLSVATSVDALAVGMTLSIVGSSIIRPAVIIGAVTFFLSFGGVMLGDCGRHISERKVQILGGILLIGIGARILLEHLRS